MPASIFKPLFNWIPAFARQPVAYVFLVAQARQ
jgi:hypothetical protein